MDITEVDAALVYAEAVKIKFLPWLGRTLRIGVLAFFTAIGFVVGVVFRAVTTALQAVLTAIGWTAGIVWLSLTFCALSVYYGFLKATRKPPAPPRQPSLL